jgi:hypothetical protein
VVDAGFVPADAAPNWVFEPNVRIFLASIVALYGTAPIAVTAAVVLPCAKPRRIRLNSDGLLFAQGPFLSLWGRQFRLWSDLKSLTVKHRDTSNHRVQTRFVLKFRSGGQIDFDNSQITPQDLKVLMDCIDQHAVACAVDPDVLSVWRVLEDSNLSTNQAASDGITNAAIVSIPAQ